MSDLNYAGRGRVDSACKAEEGGMAVAAPIGDNAVDGNLDKCNLGMPSRIVIISGLPGR